MPAALIWVVLAASCAAGATSPTALPPSSASTAPASTATGPPPTGTTPGVTAGPAPTTTETPAPTSPPSTTPPSTLPAPTGDCAAGTVASGTGLSATTVELAAGGAGTPRIEAVVYPRPGYAGNPWSQWGEGSVLPDGRFVSAIGDHRGADGNSYLYVYDPEEGRLDLVTDILSLVEHREGDWGYGKVHARILPAAACDAVYVGTYWGTRRGLEFGDTYQGDLLLRWNTADNTFQPIGVPVAFSGIPSLAGGGGGLVYGEAVDPFSSPDAGTFFAFDPETGSVDVVGGDHTGFRNIAVDAAGRAYFSAGGGVLRVYDPATGDVTEASGLLPGAWLRASTAPDANGIVYGVTRHPDVLFALEDGDIRTIAPVTDYVASLAMDPTGEAVYYVPGAHGTSWQYGTPLMAVDTSSGAATTVALLNDLAEDTLGLRLGGTYNIVTDPSGDRLYIGFNAGTAGEDSFGEVVLVVVHLP